MDFHLFATKFGVGSPQRQERKDRFAWAQIVIVVRCPVNMLIFSVFCCTRMYTCSTWITRIHVNRGCGVSQHFVPRLTRLFGFVCTVSVHVPAQTRMDTCQRQLHLHMRDSSLKRGPTLHTHTETTLNLNATCLGSILPLR